MKKTTVSKALVSSSLALGLVVGGAGVAQASPASSGSTVAAVQSATSTLTAAQWAAIARNAAAAGDSAAAQTANRYASSGQGSSTVGAASLGGIVKAAIKAALKYGYAYLPKPIKPFANKILNVLEALEDWTEGPIIFALMQVGVPYDVAQAAAFWIVTFAL